MLCLNVSCPNVDLVAVDDDQMILFISVSENTVSDFLFLCSAKENVVLITHTRTKMF